MDNKNRKNTEQSRLRMFLTGDFNLTTLCQLFVQYYNKAIYANLFGDPDTLYQTVLEGNWTIDKMSELISASYIDLDGNGKLTPFSINPLSRI